MNSDKKESLLNLNSEKTDSKNNGFLGLSKTSKDLEFESTDEEKSLWRRSLSFGANTVSNLIGLFDYIFKPFSEKGVGVEDAIKEMQNESSLPKKIITVALKAPQILLGAISSSLASSLGFFENEDKIKELQKTEQDMYEKALKEKTEKESSLKKELQEMKKKIESTKAEGVSDITKEKVNGKIGIPISFDNEKPVSGGCADVYNNVYKKGVDKNTKKEYSFSKKLEEKIKNRLQDKAI